MKVKKLTLEKGTTVSDLAHDAERMLSAREGLKTQLLVTLDGAYIVQAHSRSERGLRWIGLDRWLTLTLTPSGENACLARSSAGSWLYQSCLIATGVFLAAWPLAVTAAIGMIREFLLIKKTNRFIKSSLD